MGGCLWRAGFADEGFREGGQSSHTRQAWDPRRANPGRPGQRGYARGHKFPPVGGDGVSPCFVWSNGGQYKRRKKCVQIELQREARWSFYVARRLPVRASGGVVVALSRSYRGIVRVWELAEELRVESAHVLALIEPYDKYVRSHLSTVPELALRAIRADPPDPTRSYSDYWWSPPSVPRAPARPRAMGRFRRRPGPKPVSFEPPYEEDEHGYGNDPTAELRYEPIWSTRDVAQYYRLKPATVRQWVHRGHLTPSGKEGASHVFENHVVSQAVGRIKARQKRAGRTSSGRDSSSDGRLDARQLDRRAKVYPDSLVTTKEVASMLGIAPETIRAWVRRGHLVSQPTSTSRQLQFRIADVYKAARRRL
jgi:predicted site-specific integrase-resolvase